MQNYISINNIRLHVVEKGPKSGDLIIFLHGFPEFSYGWHRQMEWFSNKGYRTIVPDQRGYNLSDKPRGIKAYIMENLVEDVAALIRNYSDKPIFLVGHDWGAIVAWYVAAFYPQMIKKMVVLNIPHPDIIKKTLRNNIQQILKSSYVFFAQIPWLPEKILQITDYQILIQAMKVSSNSDTFTKEDIYQYKNSWKIPGTMQAMINWYRAARYNNIKLISKITVPVLIIWGKDEKFLIEQMAHLSLTKCENARIYFVENATHWLHHEKPQEVNALIENFFKE